MQGYIPANYDGNKQPVIDLVSGRIIAYVNSQLLVFLGSSATHCVSYAFQSLMTQSHGEGRESEETNSAFLVLGAFQLRGSNGRCLVST